VLSQPDIDALWARSHRLSYPGVVEAPAPKAKPASTAGPAHSDDDVPLALSSGRARTAKSSSNVDARSLRSSGKAKASGSRSKYVVSDDDDESAVEIISAPKTRGPSLGDSAVCVPLDKKKEATRLTSGRPRHHEGKSSRNAVRAVSPAPDAVSTAVLEMLPKPRQLVRLILFLSFHLFLLIVLFQPKMKCTRCMTVKIQGKSSQCEFRGLGSACGTCFSTGATRCSFELNPEEVGLMVNELFKPWQSLTLSCTFFLFILSHFSNY
jgi:hypothetical protein